MSQKLNYRPDIDGLRGISILLVVGYHFFPSIFKVGYIGVDIFFVISGYLITKIIINEHLDNTFSIIRFYQRRVRRIFPSLLLVLFSTVFLGWILFLPHEFENLGAQVLGGATFTENFVMWGQSGYFDLLANTKPLLHLWSLSIEEQFYLIWPLVLFALYRFKVPILKMMLLITFLSFLFNLYLMMNDQIGNFYSPLARVWELLLGGILGYRDVEKRNNNYNLFKLKKAYYLSGIFIAIIICIGFGLLGPSEDISYPGYFATIPIFCALLIISEEHSFFNKYLLSNRILVWFGLISYPLYLWHWVFLVFIKQISQIDLSFKVLALVLILSIFVSWLTFQILEKKIQKYYSDRIFFGLILLMICAAFLGKGIELNLISSSFNNSFSQNNFFQKKGRESDASCEKFLKFSVKKDSVCITNSRSPEILFLGDSHAMSLSSSIMNDLVDRSAIVIARHGCLLLMEGKMMQGVEDITSDCASVMQDAKRLLMTVASIKIVIINSRDSYYITYPSYKFFTGDQNQIEQTNISFYKHQYQLALSELLKFNKKITYVIDVPELKVAPKECNSVRPITLLNSDNPRCVQNISEALEKQITYRQIWNELQLEFPKVNIIDSFNAFCDKNFCYGSSGTENWYFDNNHLTAIGSQKLINMIINQLN